MFHHIKRLEFVSRVSTLVTTILKILKNEHI